MGAEMVFTPKNVFLSILYLLISIVLLFLLDLGLDWFIGNIVFSVLDWFNHLNIFFKILVLILGGGSLFMALLELTGRLSTLLGGLIFNKFPQNLFTVIAPFVLSIVNSIWYIVLLWKVPEHYNFWIVFELIFISVFIWQLSAIVMPAKEQIKAYREN